MTRMGRNYVIGPPPDYRIYGVSDVGAPVTADRACTWTLGGGALVEPGSEALAFDVFPDRANPARVFAIALPAAAVDPVGSVYRSLDGGLTYEGPVFSPPAAATGTGVETAFSSPQTVYVTWHERRTAASPTSQRLERRRRQLDQHRHLPRAGRRDALPDRCGPDRRGKTCIFAIMSRPPARTRSKRSP